MFEGEVCSPQQEAGPNVVREVRPPVDDEKRLAQLRIQLDQIFSNPQEFNKMIGAALAVTRNKQRAEDIVNSAYERIVRKLANFKEDGSGTLRDWVFGFIRRMASEKLRAADRPGHNVAMVVEDDEGGKKSVHDRDKTTPSATTTVAGREVGAIISRVLTGLPTQLAEVVRLVYLEEKTRKEAALVLRISEEEVKARLARAMKLVREDRQMVSSADQAALGEDYEEAA